MAGDFWQKAGNWLGNTFGWNQAQAAQKGREQEQQGVAGEFGVAGQAGQYGGQQLGASQAQERGINQSLGANSGQTIQRATAAAQPVARQTAEYAGRGAAQQTLSAARTAGLNKGQAALEGGQAGGQAYQAAYMPALQQQIGNYMGATGQRMGYQGQLAQQGLGGLGTAAGAYGQGAATGSDYAAGQGAQGQTGAKMFGQTMQGLGSSIAGLAKGGVADKPTLAGEAGPEVVIPVKKLMKMRKAKDLIKQLEPEIEATTEALPEESGKPTIEDLMKRIEALEGTKDE